MIVLVVCLLLLASLVGIAVIAANAAAYNQAQAVIETAKAAQIAAQGQREQTLLIAFLVGVIVLLLLAILAGLGFLAVKYWQLRTHPPAETGRWAGGPNAHWGRVGSGSAPQLDSQALMLMALTSLLGSQQPPPGARPDPNQLAELPAGEERWRF